MDKYKVNEVKSYKWNSLKEEPPKNAVLYVLDPITKEIELFITDKKGVPRTVKSVIPQINIKDYVKQNIYNDIIVESNQLFVKKYNSGDEYIVIENSPTDYKIRLNVDKIELIENKQDNLNPDGTGTKYPTVDAVNDKFYEVDLKIEEISSTFLPIYVHFSGQTTVVVNHNLERYVVVSVLIGTEIALADVEQDTSMNTVTVRFSTPQTGIIIITP